MQLKPANQVIGRYDIVSILGRGTYSQVYLANDRALKRRVALKVLKEFDSSETGSKESRLHEARILAKLNHPNIVTIFDTFEHDGSIFIAMENLSGGSVSGPGPFPARQNLPDLFRQIAAAIAYAHENNILHGDIKPSNIVFAHDGTPKVIDFGLAKLTGQAAVLSTLSQNAEMGSSFMGTLPYMAPELMRGEEPGPWTDVFALGAVYYQLVFGRPAFAGPNEAAILGAVMSGNLPVFASANDPTEAALQSLIKQMLASDKNKRPVSMAAVVSELNRMPVATPGQRGPLQNAPLSSSWTRLSFWKAGLTAALMGGMLVGQSGSSQNIGIHSTQKIMSSLEAGFAHLRQFGKKGELAAAQLAFEHVLLADPENAAATAGLALTMLRRYTAENRDPSLLNRAKDTAKLAVSLDKNLAIAHLAMGRVLKQDGMYEEARPYFNRTIELNPANVEAHIDLAFVEHRTGETDKGVARLEQLPQTLQNTKEVARALARLYYAAGRYGKAEKAFARQISIGPDDARAYSNLSAMQHLQGKTLEAISTLQQGLMIRPSRTLYSNLGTYLFFLKQYPQAVSAFEDALNIQGGTNDYRIWANLADAYSMVDGKRAKARQAYQRAGQLLVEQFPAWKDNKTLVSKLSLYQAKTGNISEAEVNIDSVMKDGSAAPDVLFRAAVVKELSGNRPEALLLVEAALTKGYPAIEIENAPELFVLRQSPEFHILQTKLTIKSNT
ncbi:MAG: protein kinase [Kordiimonadaceae bacterium]|nr:protein kinase [Kordiimonadaceae bacterium]MBO6567518.1 protein kinase [Kordiimonadaceae bacterium]MBO6963268.1 protein kinase [Kordiimonadaceae bacterium]